MTCIAAVRTKGGVWVGADSCGSNGWVWDSRLDDKVFIRHGMIFGFTTSFRMGQILRYRLPIPQLNSRDLYEYMATDFVDNVRRALSDGGFEKEKDSQKIGGTFIVGTMGRLFVVDSDYQIAESRRDYCAVGSGFAHAEAVLAVLEDQEPSVRILSALSVAQDHVATVRGPFKVMTVSAAGLGVADEVPA